MTRIFKLSLALSLLFFCLFTGCETKETETADKIQEPSQTNEVNVESEADENLPPANTSIEEPVNQTTEEPKPEVQEEKGKEVVESITTVEIAEKESDWKRAYEKGLELVKANELKKASFYFTNALGKNPGNMDVITSYTDVLFRLKTAAGTSETAFEYLNIADVFLQGQIASVPEDKVEELLALIQKVANQKQELESAMDSEEMADESTDTSQEADPLAESLDSLNSALDEQKQFVRQSIQAGRPDIASYQLQECEQIMRGLIAILPKLSSSQQDSIAQKYSELKSLSEEVVDKKAEKIWQEYKADHAQCEQSLTYLSYSSSPSYGGGDGPCQQQILKIQKQIVKLQQIMPSLSPKYLGNIAQTGNSKETAAGLMQEMQSKLQNAVKIQQQSYNAWALVKIKTCLDDCKEGVGYFTNGLEGRTKIGKSLIENLGPIDPQYLTNEVNRCFQEVQNKYLADNQLNPPKTSEDFEEPGTKLHTLKGMYEKTKIKISQF